MICCSPSREPSSLQRDSHCLKDVTLDLQGLQAWLGVRALGNLTFIQVTCGWGRPVILQENRPICPSLTTARPSLVANFGGHSPQMLGRVSAAGVASLSLGRNHVRQQSDLLSSTPLKSHRLGLHSIRGVQFIPTLASDFLMTLLEREMATIISSTSCACS